MSLDGITEVRHLLHRTGFAEPPASVVAAAAEPPAEHLAARLASAAPIAPLAPPAWAHEPTLSQRTFRDLPPERRRAARGAVRRVQRDRLAELQAWWLSNLILTENPLGARMTLFWQNHFTSEQRKVRYTELMYRQQRTLMRHATGRFDELLLAMLRDPAMLTYLDNRRSRRQSPNENLARELLELFTLGEGQYAEGDIRELARALTGLSVDERERYVFRDRWHDPEPKRLLGETDVRGVLDVVEVLVGHPATATRLVERLWRHFVSPEPPPDAVRRLAERFRASELDVSALLAALFSEAAFLDPDVRGTLVRSPVEFVVGTHRALGLAPSEPPTLARAARAMQQSLYEPPNVRGWVGGKRWLNSQTLLARRRFVNGMLRNDALDAEALVGPLDDATLAATLLPFPPQASTRHTGRAPKRRLARLLHDPAYHLC